MLPSGLLGAAEVDRLPGSQTPTYAFFVVRYDGRRNGALLPLWLTTFTDATLTLNMNSTAALISGLVASVRTLNTYWFEAAARSALQRRAGLPAS
jgi:hypothetical protein